MRFENSLGMYCLFINFLFSMFYNSNIKIEHLWISKIPYYLFLLPNKTIIIPIQNFNSWTSAFIGYISVLIERFPNKVHV